MANNILAEIELNEKQIKAFNEELNKWKEKKEEEIKENLASELKTEFEVKVRELAEEKANFEKKQTDLVEEIKNKMQKVMVKRFTSALKDMYDELKVEARKDVMNDPRILALEEIKSVVYPLMDETVTKGYVDELATALRVVETKEDENDRLKAKLKLKEITSSLAPVVAEAVEAFIGNASTEEEVVEKYSKLKNLANEASEDEEEEEEPEEDEEEEDDGKKKSKKAKKGKKDDEEEEPEEEVDEAKKDDEDEESEEDDEDEESEEDDEDEEDDKDDEDEDKADEGLEIRPSVHFEKKEVEDSEDHLATLNEMLDLAGVPTK